VHVCVCVCVNEKNVLGLQSVKKQPGLAYLTLPLELRILGGGLGWKLLIWEFLIR